MTRPIPSPYPDRGCFFCGPDNPSGLGLRFFHDPETDEVTTEYRAPRTFSGMGDLLHGGIQIGILDEAMGWATHHLVSPWAVTVDVHATFMRPVYLERPIRVVCRIVDREGGLVDLAAHIEDEDGEVCTTGTGTYRVLPRHRFESILRPADP